MRACWSADTSHVEAERWHDATHHGISADASPWLRLLAQSFTARTSGRAGRGPLDALLDLRVQAFHLQVARAHDLPAHL